MSSKLLEGPMDYDSIACKLYTFVQLVEREYLSTRIPKHLVAALFLAVGGTARGAELASRDPKLRVVVKDDQRKNWMLAHAEPATRDLALRTFNLRGKEALTSLISAFYLRIHYSPTFSKHAVFLSPGTTAALTWGGWERVRTVFDTRKLSALLRPLLANRAIGFFVQHGSRYVSAVYFPAQRVIEWIDPIWDGDKRAFDAEHADITSVLSWVLKRRVPIEKRVAGKAHLEEPEESLLVAHFNAEYAACAALFPSGPLAATAAGAPPLISQRGAMPLPVDPWFHRRIKFAYLLFDKVCDLAKASKGMPVDPVVAAIRSSVYLEEEPGP
ncbi:hypothetical protein H9P43_005842 [Blastocladiella emersonii ATCC 22665]|nr:hypothetical protein H9P43_005842 [Blastocladiella emersonii ATCC 22665]